MKFKTSKSIRTGVCSYTVLGFILISQPLFANDTYDASEFEYAGVRFGLTVEQTIEVLSRNLGIDPDSFEMKNSGKYKVSGPNISTLNFSEIKAKGDIKIEQTEYRFKDGRWAGRLFFDTDIRKNPITEPGLAWITLERANEIDTKKLVSKETSANSDELAQQLSEKIGPPSVGGYRTRWCTALRDDGKNCADGTSQISVSTTLDVPSGGSITMNDEALRELFGRIPSEYKVSQ